MDNIQIEEDEHRPDGNEYEHDISDNFYVFGLFFFLHADPILNGLWSHSYTMKSEDGKVQASVLICAALLDKKEGESLIAQLKSTFHFPT